MVYPYSKVCKDANGKITVLVYRNDNMVIDKIRHFEQLGDQQYFNTETSIIMCPIHS